MSCQAARTRAVAPLLLILTAACASRSAAPPAAATSPRYTIYVSNEASDLVTTHVFTPGGDPATLGRVGVGAPGRIAGPHGIAVAPDGVYWYVTLAHGTPRGTVRKYAVSDDSLIGAASAGVFPEAVAVTPDGEYLFVTNRDLQGSAAVSSVSVIYTGTMTEVARPATCVQPRGGRLNATASRHYSVCAVSDELIAIDTRSFEVAERFPLAGCGPVWAEPGRAARAAFIYVTCATGGEILEIDALQWRVTRRFPVAGATQSAADPTGAVLLATLSSENAVAVIDLAAGTEHSRIPTSQPSPHGIVITDDGAFAFVTNEGAGIARGTVDVLDLATLRRVGSVTAAYAPGGIDVLHR